jgi:hypothetical protein
MGPAAVRECSRVWPATSEVHCRRRAPSRRGSRTARAGRSRALHRGGRRERLRRQVRSPRGHQCGSAGDRDRRAELGIARSLGRVRGSYLVIAGHEFEPAYQAWLDRSLPQARVTVWPGSGHFRTWLSRRHALAGRWPSGSRGGHRGVAVVRCDRAVGPPMPARRSWPCGRAAGDRRRRQDHPLGQEQEREGPDLLAALAHGIGAVLGQLAVEEKSNEIRDVIYQEDK